MESISSIKPLGSGLTSITSTVRSRVTRRPCRHTAGRTSLMAVFPQRGRLLTVVGSQFGDPAGSDGPIGYPALPFSAALADQLVERLSVFGYASVERFNDLSAIDLGEQIERFLDS